MIGLYPKEDLRWHLWLCELQKWLWDAHSIIVQPEFVKPGYTDYKVQYWDMRSLPDRGEYTYLNGYVKEGDYHAIFYSQPEALAAGIEKALTLI